MSKEIFEVRSMGDALRNTGYRGIDCAIAEIVDNSIEAGAKDVFVITSECTNENTGHKGICEIAFLDNGSGMSEMELRGCLSIGCSTRRARKGMGRFGVGLPQASLYACTNVEVYSWQNGAANCKKVFLDINKIKQGEQKDIDEPTPTQVPDKYKTYLDYTIVKTDVPQKCNFAEHGTLVVWHNCDSDRVRPRASWGLFNKIEKPLGQKYRHFINDGKCSIKLIEDANKDNIRIVLPNDPLMLMDNNVVLGDPEQPAKCGKRKEGFTQAIFEPYANPKFPNQAADGNIVVPVKYMDSDGAIKESSVRIRFSIVKPAFYDRDAIPSGDPGTYAIGKHAKTVAGISIVRAGREIDFGRFNFYEDVNEPTHRWWGCEVSFEPELDEAFCVANNKQQVELKKVESDDAFLFGDVDVEPMWLQLSGYIIPTIKDMVKRNKEIRKQSRSQKDIVMSPAVMIVNSAEKINDGESQAKLERESISDADLFRMVKDRIFADTGKDATDDDVRQYMGNKVNITSKRSGNAPLFDFDFSLGCCAITINEDDPFYDEFLTRIYEDSDLRTSFELLVSAYGMAMNETNVHQLNQNNQLLHKWMSKLRDYMYILRNPDE